MQVSLKPAGLSAQGEDHGPVPGVAAARPLSRAWMSDELVAQTRRVWSPVYGRVLAEDEAVEILVNVKRFAEVLLRAGAEVKKS